MTTLRATFNGAIGGNMPTTLSRNAATKTYDGVDVPANQPRFFHRSRVEVVPQALTEFGSNAGGLTFGGFDAGGQSIFGVFSNGTLRIWRGALADNDYASPLVTSQYGVGAPDFERDTVANRRYPINSAGQVYRGLFVCASAIVGETGDPFPGVRIYVGDVAALEALSAADRLDSGAAHAGFEIVKQRAVDGNLYDDDEDEPSGTDTQKVAARWCVTGPFTPDHDGDGEPSRTLWKVCEYRVKTDPRTKGGRAWVFSIDHHPDGTHTVNEAIRWDISVAGGADHIHPGWIVRDPEDAARAIVYLPVGDLRTPSHIEAIRLNDLDNYSAVSGGAYSNVTDLGTVFGLNGGTGPDINRGGLQPLALFQHPTDRTAAIIGKDEQGTKSAIIVARAVSSDGAMEVSGLWGFDSSFSRTRNPQTRIALYGMSLYPWRSDSIAVCRMAATSLAATGDDYIGVAISPDGGLTWGDFYMDMSATGVPSGLTGFHLTLTATDIVLDANESSKILYAPIPRMTRGQAICVGPGRSNQLIGRAGWGLLGSFGVPPSMLFPGDAGYVPAPPGLPVFAADAGDTAYIKSDATNDGLTSSTLGRRRLFGTTTFVQPTVTLRSWAASDMRPELVEPGDCAMGMRVTHGGTAIANLNGAVLQTDGIGEWCSLIGQVVLADDATARDIQILFGLNLLDLVTPFDQFLHKHVELGFIGAGSLGYPVAKGTISPPHERLASDLTRIGTAAAWTVIERGRNEGLGFDSQFVFPGNGLPLGTIKADDTHFIEVFARKNGFRFRVTNGASTTDIDINAGKWWPSHSYAWAISYDGTHLRCYATHANRPWTAATAAAVDLTDWSLTEWHNLNEAETDCAERCITERIASDTASADGDTLTLLIQTIASGSRLPRVRSRARSALPALG